MRTARILRSWLLLSVIAAWLPACTARGARSFRLVPVPGPSYSIEGDVASIKTDTMRLTVVQLDDVARSAFIKGRAAAAADPFGPAKNGDPRYLTFRLVIENLGSKDPITFQPQSIIMAQESGDRLYPLDFPEAYRRLAGGENSDPRLLDDLSKYMFDVGVNLESGQRVDRLLIYPAGRLRAKKVRMEFSFLEALSSSAHYDILFLREPRP